MCPDNPNIRNNPADLIALQDAEIAAQVRSIFAHESFTRLRARYVGRSDLELLRMIVLQAGFVVLLEGKPKTPVIFHEDEFAR